MIIQKYFFVKKIRKKKSQTKFVEKKIQQKKEFQGEIYVSKYLLSE
jgi:hypothetical protein